MFPEIERVLIGRGRIADRVRELAAELARDIEADLAKEGDNRLSEDRVVIIPIMTGAIIFTADLMRELPVKLSLGLVTVSSYPGQSVESKGVHLATALPENLTGKHVIIIDDILDSGRTIGTIKKLVMEQNPASVRAIVLLDKKERRVEPVEADYVGFEIPDEFVVGYGLDYDGYYRNHPDIVILKREAFADKP